MISSIDSSSIDPVGSATTLVLKQVAAFEARLDALGLAARLGLEPVALRSLKWTEATRAGIQIDLLSLHELHPVLSGNKWFKLKYHLPDALTGRPVLSLGGVHSNHLHALAWVGAQLGLDTHGLITGDGDSPTLDDARAWGMNLHRVSRAEYREARASGQMPVGIAGAVVIPEGGAHRLGVLGASTIVASCEAAYDEVHLACGTGCTLAGVRLGLPPETRVVGWSTHRGDWLAGDCDAWIQSLAGDHPVGGWQVIPSQQRFGPVPASQWNDAQALGATLGIPVEPVYMARVLGGLATRIARGAIPEGARLLVIHGGGLQGARAVQQASGLS